MKTPLPILLFLSLFITCLFPAKAQQWSNSPSPLQQDTLIGKIQFISSTEAWIATGKGGAIHTTDGGLNWTKIQPFPGDSLHVPSDAAMGMSWPDALHGYILASKGNNPFLSKGVVLLKTTDGGNTWTKSEIDNNNNYGGLQIQFVNANEGWLNLFNQNKGIRHLHTSNGGQSWDTLTYNGFSSYQNIVTTFHYLDAQNGWATTTWNMNDGTGTHWSIEKTNDGGSNWQEVYTYPAAYTGGLYFLKALSPTSCIAEAPGKQFLKTTDGGLSWTSIPFPIYYDTLSAHKAFDFISDLEGWISEDPEDNSKECIIHHTTDGGLSWEVQVTGLYDGSIFDLAFFDSNTGFLSGESCLNCSSGNQNEYSQIRKFDGQGTFNTNFDPAGNWMISPNPSNGLFKITGQGPIDAVECIHLNGSKVDLTGLNLKEASIDLSKHAAGMYLVNVQSGSTFIHFRIIKER